MSKKAYKCPNCGSEFCSGIKFWREGKQVSSFDAYSCHDCGMLTNPATRDELPPNWQPIKRSKTAGQMDLFGGMANPRDAVEQVPRLVEAPDGSIVIVSLIPADSPKVLREEIKKMSSELQKTSSGTSRPFWYKYRKIQRGNKTTKK